MKNTLLIALLMTIYMPVSLAVPTAGPAANFTLKSASGNNVRLSEHRGEVVLINFWASWCGPCRQEMPHLDALQKKYQALGFIVLGINVEQNRGMADKVLKDIPVSFQILFDDENQVSELYDVDAMPVTVLVDRSGEIRFVHRGYRPGFEDEYESQIRALIKE